MRKTPKHIVNALIRAKNHQESIYLLKGQVIDYFDSNNINLYNLDLEEKINAYIEDSDCNSLEGVIESLDLILNTKENKLLSLTSFLSGIDYDYVIFNDKIKIRDIQLNKEYPIEYELSNDGVANLVNDVKSFVESYVEILKVDLLEAEYNQEYLDGLTVEQILDLAKMVGLQNTYKYKFIKCVQSPTLIYLDKQ